MSGKVGWPLGKPRSEETRKKNDGAGINNLSGQGTAGSMRTMALIHMPRAASIDRP